MGRTRTFDIDDTLDKAMSLFWQRGYDGTSMQALVDQTGLNRSSLYATFGDKRSLYLLALNRYANHRVSGIVWLMEQDIPVRDAFRRLYEVFVDEAVEFLDRRGCFLVNATVEQAPHNQDTDQALRRGNEELTNAFANALDRARKHGEIDENLDPKALALYFLNSFNGIRVTVKTLPDREALHRIIDVTLSVLD